MSDIKEKVEELKGTYGDRVRSMADAIENKLGISKDEVVTDFENMKSNLGDILPTNDEDVIENRAWIRFKQKWNRELKSDVPVFEGMIVGVGNAFDALGGKHSRAKSLFEENPEKAIEEGITDEDGNALDTNKTLWNGDKNPNYGEPIPDHKWLRYVFGSCMKVDDDNAEPDKFWMTLEGENALKEDIPTMEPVRFRANVAQSRKNGFLKLYPVNNITFTRFESDELTADNIMKSGMFDDIFVDIDELNEIPQNKLGNREVHITEGDVGYVSTRPNPKTGNKRLTILPDNGSDDYGYTVWVPEHLVDDVDFGVGSRLVLAANIMEDEFNEKKTFSMRAWGFHAYDDMKIPEGASLDAKKADYVEPDPYSDMY